MTTIPTLINIMKIRRSLYFCNKVVEVIAGKRKMYESDSGVFSSYFFQIIIINGVLVNESKDI